MNFTRQLGGAVGVAIAASVMLTTLTGRITSIFPSGNVKASSLLSAQAASTFPPETRAAIQDAFSGSLHPVFITMLLIAGIGVAVSFLMPSGSPTAIRDAAHGRVPAEVLLPDGETFVIVDPFDEEGGATELEGAAAARRRPTWHPRAHEPQGRRGPAGRPARGDAVCSPGSPRSRWPTWPRR